jgi:WD40 repeat protein
MAEGCPSAERLRLLLEEQLPPAEQQAVEGHVEGCPGCQDALDRLSRPADPAPWRPAPDPAATHDDALQFLDQLKTTVPARDSEAAAAAPAISFPGPPTPRGPLGQLGDYHVAELLGQGTFGVVYLAWDPALDQPVAIKVLRPEHAAHGTARKRFVREGRTLASVRHEHVVHIHRLVEPAGFPPYLVMEYVAGEPLSRRLRSDHVVPPREAARLVREAALGLVAIHGQGLVHRDVKPANLMVERNGGRVKITDFGLAREYHPDRTAFSLAREVLGTFAYMSPEQVRCPDAVDGRSDVYSLGCVLYELLTGTPPFRGAEQFILHQHLHEEPRSPLHLNPEVPRELAVITLKCLAKEPGRRYATAGDLAEDLRRFLAGEPILARPEGRLKRIERWARRHPAAALAAVALAVLAVLSTAFAYREFKALRESRERLRLAAQLAIGIGADQCERGEVAAGMMWFLRGLKLAPEDEHVRWLAQAQMAAWGGRLPGLRAPGYVALASAVAPGGDRLITVGLDPRAPAEDLAQVVGGLAYRVSVWDLATGRRVRSDPLPVPLLAGSLAAVAFRPDGGWVVAAYIPSASKVFIIASAGGGEPRVREVPRKVPVRLLALSGDGSVLFACAADARRRDATAEPGAGELPTHVSYWKVTEPDAPGSWVSHSRFIDRLLPSPGGRYLLAVDQEQNAWLWDLADGKSTAQAADHRGPATALAFSPDERWLLHQPGEAQLFLRDLAAGADLPAALPQRSVVRQAWFAGNDTLWTASDDGRVCEWEVPTGRLRRQSFSPGAEDAPALSPVFSPTRFLVRDRPGPPAPGIEPVALVELPGRLRHLGFASPDRLATVVGSGAAPACRLWDARTGAAAGQPAPPPKGDFPGGETSEDGRLLLGQADPDGRTAWDAVAGVPVRLPEQQPVLTYSASKQRVLTRQPLDPEAGDVAPPVELWDLRTGRNVPLSPPPLAPRLVHWDPDGDYLLVLDRQGLWHGKAAGPSVAMERLALDLPEDQTIDHIALSKDGQGLAVAGKGVVFLWRLGPRPTPALSAPKLRDAVDALTFSPDGRLLATLGTEAATGQAVLRLWDSASGIPVGPPIKVGPADAPSRSLNDAAPLPLAFAPDGSLVAVAGGDAVRVFRIPVVTDEDMRALEARLVALTGLRLTEAGAIVPLDEEAWQRL